MTCFTEGIQATRPVQWRGLDGLVGVYWTAEAEADARGYYLSPDPRIVLFFEDVSAQVQMSNQEQGFAQHSRPMTRAVYVPAGVPLWTRFSARHRFSHLDLHLHADRLLRFLSPSVGRSAALAALRTPVEIQDAQAITALAGLVVAEVCAPRRHDVFAETLVGGIVTGLLEIPEEGSAWAAGGMTPAQMSKLIARLDDRADRRLSVAEMAETVGLSESWFASVFKQTTGKTPQKWQLERRIDRVQDMLMATDLSVSAIAAQLGFSDQAQLTKAFGQVSGETPAAWRRARRAG